MSLECAKAGTRQEALSVLRNHLIDTLEAADPHSVAGPVHQLQAILVEIDELSQPLDGGTNADQKSGELAVADASQIGSPYLHTSRIRTSMSLY